MDIEELDNQLDAIYGEDPETEITPLLDPSPTSLFLPENYSIFIQSFGCPHNYSDGEYIAGCLRKEGYKITQNISESDLCIFNSCTVKNPSQDTLMNYIQKAISQGKKVIAAGCVPQADRNLPFLQKNCSLLGLFQLPLAGLVAEESLKGNRVHLLSRPACPLPKLSLPKIRRNEYIEIIPVSTGCLGNCTYCKTRQARGKLASYPTLEIENRVKEVVREGIKDIWLTSEDTGAYGRDAGNSLSQLLFGLLPLLPGGVMLRVGMTNPPYILDQLDDIALILKHPRVYEFLHIPVQSGSDSVLKHMRREYTIAEFESVVNYIRQKVPGVFIATDIICGYPSERDIDFGYTMDLIEKYQFPMVNISQFYPRPDTPAFRMKRVPTNEVKERSRELTKLFNRYKQHSLDGFKGNKVRVWITEIELEKGTGDRLLSGHTKNYVKVLIKWQKGLIGKTVIVKVVHTHLWHINGVLIDPNPLPLPIPSHYLEPKLFSHHKFPPQINLQEKKGSNAQIFFILGIILLMAGILLFVRGLYKT